MPSSNLTSEVEPIRSSPSVADAKGKLGVMIPVLFAKTPADSEINNIAAAISTPICYRS